MTPERMDFDANWGDWILYAMKSAADSPCQSKRGVAIFSDGDLISCGHNHQPAPFRCDGTEACRKNCGKTAVHAEQMALLLAGTKARGAQMLHVKGREGFPCASEHPRCLECSKLILFAGIAHMHLITSPGAQMLPGSAVVGSVEGWLSDNTLGELQIRRYSAEGFHWLTANYAHRIDLLLPYRKLRSAI